MFHNAAMDDDQILLDIDVSGRRAPNSPAERQQYERLIAEGYLLWVPVPLLPGDTGDPLLCELTPAGRQRVRGNR